MVVYLNMGISSNAQSATFLLSDLGYVPNTNLLHKFLGNLNCYGEKDINAIYSSAFGLVLLKLSVYCHK